MIPWTYGIWTLFRLREKRELSQLKRTNGAAPLVPKVCCEEISDMPCHAYIMRPEER